MNNGEVERAMKEGQYVCVAEDIVRAGDVYSVSEHVFIRDRWLLTNIVTGAQKELEAEVLTLAPYPPNQRIEPGRALQKELSDCLYRYKEARNPVKEFMETGRVVTPDEWRRLNEAAHLLAVFVWLNEALFRQVIMEGKSE